MIRAATGLMIVSLVFLSASGCSNSGKTPEQTPEQVFVRVGTFASLHCQGKPWGIHEVSFYKWRKKASRTGFTILKCQSSEEIDTSKCHPCHVI